MDEAIIIAARMRIHFGDRRNQEIANPTSAMPISHCHAPYRLIAFAAPSHAGLRCAATHPSTGASKKNEAPMHTPASKPSPNTDENPDRLLGMIGPGVAVVLSSIAGSLFSRSQFRRADFVGCAPGQ